MRSEVIAAPRPFPRVLPILIDACFALAVLLVGPRHILAEPHDEVRAVLLLGLVAPLLLRRRYPVPTFALIAAVALVQWVVSEPAVADVTLLVAFYSVASSCGRRYVLAAAGVLELGVLLATLKYAGPHGGHILSFVFLSGLVTAAGVLGVTVRVRRAYLHEIEQRAARLEFERDQQAQLAVAAERARVAREMHDIVAHNVSVMVALTDGAALTVYADPARAKVALAEASRAGRVALMDMRRVLGLLRDSDDAAALAPAPGLADLAQLLDAVRHTGLQVRYETSGPVGELEQGVQLSAFRIVQEAVTNTIKHASQASAIDVQLHARAEGLEVLVRDDGRATASGSASGSGHGIVGMRERAAVHSGDVQAGRTPTGWQVRAWLPLAVAEPSLAGASA
jgi:signal transduction histidine kinase